MTLSPRNRTEDIARSWSKRATVATSMAHRLNFEPEDDLPDYPIELLPFADHPQFERLPEELRQKVLSYAWLAYNQRTISAEVKVANPAFELVFDDFFPSCDMPFLKQAIRQSIVDEHFHTLLHMQAVQQTCAARGVQPLNHSPSITLRTLNEAQLAAEGRWERNLLLLVFAIVSEISINAHLNVIARARSIQPSHRRLATFHNRDEVAHARLLADYAVQLHPRLNPSQQRSFDHALPIALESFVAQDFVVWQEIFDAVGLPNGSHILADCAQAGDRRFIRDFSGLESLVDDLGIGERLEFDFRANVP